MYKYIHKCIYIYIHVRTHTHIHIHTHTHTKCMIYERTQARLERRRGSERARSRCRPRKPCTSLLFVAIKPHFAPPMQGLHCTHVLQHQYPSIPHPLLPNIPQNSSRPRASAVSLFYTDHMNRVHSSEEAPRSFTMAPCVVVERLEGKQRYSRAAIREHAGIQGREWSKCLFTRHEGSMKNNQPPQAAHHANHDSAAPRQHPLICTGAEPIHQVHGQPMSWAPESMLRTEDHISTIFPPLLGSTI